MTLQNVDIDSLPKIQKDERFFKSGSFGSVQRITWQNRDCAVKYFRKRENYQKNYSEVHNLEICNHRNIVKLYAAGPDVPKQKLYYYIMEFATHGSLDELLHEKKEIDYTLAQGLNWIYQCAEGVKYLHTSFEHPILHRDIKPANLLIFDRGKLIKLCDFGTVKSVQNTENTAESGTYIYMAPEVMTAVKDHNAYYNEKCDIYSIAILMWEILTRQKPFKNISNVFTIVTNILIKNERLEEIPDCPVRLQKLIKCCWRKKYKERPNIDDVCKILKLILGKMDNANDPLRMDDSGEEVAGEVDVPFEIEQCQETMANADDIFDVQLNLIDDSLKPHDPLEDNIESKMIFDQHKTLLNKYVNLNLECQKLEWNNNEILNEITVDTDEKERIKRFCELKIKEKQQQQSPGNP